MLEGLECSIYSILQHKAFQLSLDGLNIPLRTGCLLWDRMVAAFKVIDLSVEGLEHVLEMSKVVKGWVVWGKWHLLSHSSEFLVYHGYRLLDVINITWCMGSSVVELLYQLM